MEIANKAHGSRSFIQAAYTNRAPKTMRRMDAAAPAGVLFKKVIQSCLDQGVIEKAFTKELILPGFGNHHHGGCVRQREGAALRQIVIDGALHDRVPDQLCHFFPLGGCEDGRQGLVELAVLRPRSLFGEQHIGGWLVFAQLRAGAGQLGGLAAVSVLRQREIPVYQVHLAWSYVILYEQRQLFVMKPLAGGTLEIAEDLDGDGGLRIADSVAVNRIGSGRQCGQQCRERGQADLHTGIVPKKPEPPMDTGTTLILSVSICVHPWFQLRRYSTSKSAVRIFLFLKPSMAVTSTR